MGENFHTTNAAPVLISLLVCYFVRGKFYNNKHEKKNVHIYRIESYM